MFKRTGVPRWIFALAMFAIVAVVTARSQRFLRPFAKHTPILIITAAQYSLVADGSSTLTLDIRSADSRNISQLSLSSADDRIARIDALSISAHQAQAIVRAGVVPGHVAIHASIAGKPVASVELTTSPDESDSAQDGTPDFLRLSDEADRDAFRRWFTYLAEAQYFTPAPRADVADCAALLRFAYRESLHQHDTQWARTAQIPDSPDVPDVRQYAFPYTPLAASVFRVREGTFRASDFGDGTFAEFADANTLRRYNTHFLSRDIRRARRGDLLFFRQFDQHSPYHAMIVLGRSQFQPGENSYVIYHTGPIHGRPGEIRRPSMNELMDHPDARWRPLLQNPAFLGVYRWNILRGAD